MSEIASNLPSLVSDEDSESGPGADIDETINPADWITALNVLKEELHASGKYSSISFSKELAKRGIKAEHATQILIHLRANTFDDDWDVRLQKPDFEYTHQGRTFYSKAALEEKKGETETQAEQAALSTPLVIGEAEPTRRRNRQEEARLGTYIRTALKDIYDSDCRPDEEAEFVFDVHNERGGNDFENVDLIAFHWRTDSVVETITVEAKLDFTCRLVQQANNYRRFSTRTWIAIPCTSTEADTELREMDPLLFDYVIELGLGILACRKAKGRSYEVFPIQWPRVNRVDPVSSEGFIERYRSVFEEAQVVEKRAVRRFPKVR